MAPLAQLIAGGQRHDRHARARVREVMAAILVQGARKPAATLALMRFEPGNAAHQARVVRGDARPTRNIDGQPGRVAIARLRVLRRAIGPLITAARTDPMRPAEVRIPVGEAGQTKPGLILCHQVRTISLLRAKPGGPVIAPERDSSLRSE